MSLNLASMLEHARPLLRVQFDPTAAIASTTKGFHAGLSNTGLTFTPNGDPAYALSTIGHFDGKRYAEIEINTLEVGGSGMKVGINTYFNGTNDFNVSRGYGMQMNEYGFINIGSLVFKGGGAFNAGDWLNIAADFDAHKVWMGRNGSYFSGDPVTGTSPFASALPAGQWFLGAEATTGGASVLAVVTVRGRSQDFGSSIPTGYIAWEGW